MGEIPLYAKLLIVLLIGVVVWHAERPIKNLLGVGQLKPEVGSCYYHGQVFVFKITNKTETWKGVEYLFEFAGNTEPDLQSENNANSWVKYSMKDVDCQKYDLEQRLNDIETAIRKLMLGTGECKK